jgi:hypothetical protein
VRQNVVAVGFGADAEARNSADWLAMRLSRAMDGRARPHLLVIFTESIEDAVERVMMWAFPQEEAFRFDTGVRPRIQLLENIFSRTSGLRKAAQFQGANQRADFLTGRLVDIQAGRSATQVADYWLDGFLDCVLEMTPLVGTQLLADTFRRAFEAVETPEERSQLQVAALQIQQAPRATWTIAEVAEELLPQALAPTFLAASPAQHMNNARHELDRETFELSLATRVFELDSGVMVTAPLAAIGLSVITDGDQLRVAGTIVHERLGRGRRGR